MSKGKTAHLLLKKQAKNILRNMGFNDNEILYEKKIFTIKGRKFGYVIDVVGIKKDSVIFIECGTITNKNNKKGLKKHCDKLIHLPYLKDVSTLKNFTARKLREIIKNE